MIASLKNALTAQSAKMKRLQQQAEEARGAALLSSPSASASAVVSALSSPREAEDRPTKAPKPARLSIVARQALAQASASASAPVTATEAAPRPIAAAAAVSGRRPLTPVPVPVPTATAPAAAEVAVGLPEAVVPLTSASTTASTTSASAASVQVVFAPSSSLNSTLSAPVMCSVPRDIGFDDLLFEMRTAVADAVREMSST